MSETHPPADGGISLSELEKIENRLASLEHGLSALHGTPAAVLHAAAEPAAALSGPYTFGRPEAVSDPLAWWRQALAAGSIPVRRVLGGQLLAENRSGGTAVAGLNVLALDEGKRLFAAGSGAVHWQGDTVSIVPQQTISRDLTPADGVRDIPGDVRIDGSIADGVLLAVGGNLVVTGDIGAATVAAGGNLVVRGTVRGNGTGSLLAGGTIIAQKLEKCSVAAGAHLIAEDGMQECLAWAGGQVVATGPKAVIFGGEVRAALGITCRTLGTGGSTATAAFAGSAHADRQRRDRVRQAAEQAKTEEQKGDAMAARRGRWYAAELAAVETRLQTTHAGQINIMEAVFAGVKLGVGTAPGTPLAKEQKKVTFIDKNGTFLGENLREQPLPWLMPAPLALTADPVVAMPEQLRRCVAVTAESEGQAQAQAAPLLDVAGEQLVVMTRTAAKKEAGGKTVPGEYVVIQAMPGETRREVEALFLPQKKPASVKVQCQSIAEGLQRGADALGLTPDAVQHRVLQEKSDGVLGFGAKPYLLLVEPAKKAPPKAAPAKKPAAPVSRNGSFRIENLPQGLHVTVVPPSGSGVPVTVDEVQQYLAEQKIDKPVDADILTRAITEGKSAPVRIDLLPDKEKKAEAEKAAEAVDPALAVYACGREATEMTAAAARAFYAAYDFSDSSVRAGQLLAARLPGAPDTTPVFTGELNVLSLDDGQRLFAMYDGIVHWCDATVWMAPLRAADGVAAGETLAYDGSVVVRGPVADGATVTATGSLLIEGACGAATLVAGGDLIVRGGVAGADKAVLDAGGDIYTPYAERANLDAGGSILVEDALVHCTASAGIRILGLGPKALLGGGELRAGEEINTADLGLPSGEKTRVAVGAAATDRQRVGSVRKQLEETQAALAALDKELAAAAPERLQQLAEEKKRTAALVREREYELREIEARVKDNRSGLLAVSGTLWPGTTVIVGTAPPQEIGKETRRCSLVDRKQKLSSESYKEPLHVRRRRVRPVALAAAALALPPDPFLLLTQLGNLRRLLRTAAPAATVAVKNAAVLLGLPAKELAAFTPPVEEGKVAKKTAKGESADTEFWVAQLTEGDTVDTLRDWFFPPPKKQEVEVICESVETGLTRGAAALRLSPDEVQHRVLEEGKAGMLGVGARPWRIAVSAKPRATGGAPVVAAPRAALQQLLAACAGTYTIAVSGNELQLTVKPPRGPGKGVEAAAIKRALEQQGYRKGIDSKQLDAAVTKATGEPVTLLKLTDEQVAAATGQAPAAEPAAAVATAPDKAVEPADGTGTRLYTWPWQRERELTLKELRALLAGGETGDLSVRAGQLLAASLAAGEDGDVFFTPGEQVLCGDGGRRLFAAVDGIVCWAGDHVAVSPIRHVEGDLTVQTGNIVTAGSIMIAGNVADGLVLQADGDIVVGGTVGRTTLVAGGSVIVRKGILGGSQGRVSAGNDIYAGFVENAALEAENNIIVDEAILHSRVVAGARIVCTGEKGVIAGGTLQAGEEVNCRDLGTTAGVETSVLVGARGSDKEALEQVRRDSALAKEQLDAVTQAVAGLITRKAAGTLTDEGKAMLEQQLAAKKKAGDLLQRLQAQEKRLTTALAAAHSGMVNVAGIAYPGVKMIIGRSDPTAVGKEEKRPCFLEKEGRVVAEVYREPKVKRRSTLAVAPAADHVPVNLEEHAAKLARTRKIMRLTATDMETAGRQGAHFLGLSADQLLIFALPEPAPAAAGKKGAPVPAGPKTFVAVQTVAGDNPAALERKYAPGPRRTSVEVTCESVAAGLQEAAKLLGEPPERLQHKVIQEMSKGMFGVGHKPYILRVSVKAKAEHPSPAAAFARLDEKEDGRFVLANSDQGLVLIVYPAKGEGTKVTPDAVRAELDKRRYRTGLDMKLLTETVRQATGAETVIGPRQPEPELDGSFSIAVAPDKMTCTVTVQAAKPLGRATTAEELVEALAEQGVTRCELTAIQKIFAEGLYGTPVVVAQGLPAQPAQDGRLEFKVNLGTSRAKLAEDDSGHVDFHEMNLLESVTAGQVIALRHAPVPGTPGIDVYNREVLVKPARDAQYTFGRNVAVTPDGREVTATADGQVVLIGRVLRVEPVHLVSGDVDFSTGNINFLGAVVVKGTVRQGFSVRAAGNIMAGDVEKATLEAEGSIIIGGGIIGDEHGRLQAGEDIRARFVEAAHLQAGRDVVVQETIMHSTVGAGRAVICHAGKKGVIIGGTVRAGRAVHAKELGTAVATKTAIEVGLDPHLRQQAADLEKMLQDYAAHAHKVRLGLKVLLEVKQKAGTLPPEKETLLQQLQGAAGNLQQRVHKAEQQLQVLQAKLAEKREGTISASQYVHPGCHLVIRNATLNIENTVQRTTFVYDQGEIRAAEYTEPRLKDDTDDAE